MKNPRSRAREELLKVLYQIEILKERPSVSDVSRYFEETSLRKSSRKYGEQLMKGCIEKSEAIDAAIQNQLTKKKLHHLAVIDKTILRIATFELLYQPDVPPKVAINEAIQLAKKYSTDKSGGFVNGILDAVKRMVRDENRRNDQPAPHKTEEERS